MSNVLLSMEHITKTFPGVKALDDVSFEARAGEVLALVGENGAGKSTLMKVLSGAWPYPSYQGDIKINGSLHRFSNTKEAEEAGVGIIYQELNLIPELSVAENIFLDRHFTHNGGMINWLKVNAEANKLLASLQEEGIGATTLVEELQVGKQQMVEIAKALSLNAKILVLDEPTSALTDKEVEDLFTVIRKLKSQGVCMIYITHKMDEIRQIADRVAILRDGSTIGSPTPSADISLDEIITKMVGREIQDMYPKHSLQKGDLTLEVKNMEVDHPFLPGEKKVKQVSFKAYKGELLGIAGLMGSGRSELVNGIFGAFPESTKGEVFLHGNRLKISSPKDAISHGIALLTEDRKQLGLFLETDLCINTTIASLKQFTRFGIINHLEESKVTGKYTSDLSIKTPSVKVAVETLSGGNQQKVVIAKWLNTRPKVLIMDEPTRGIDVGARSEIYKLMHRLLADGVTIIMVSSDLPEILGMSDRILVMCEGELVADISKEEATTEKVMGFATGRFKLAEN